LHTLDNIALSKTEQTTDALLMGGKGDYGSIQKSVNCMEKGLRDGNVTFDKEAFVVAAKPCPNTVAATFSKKNKNK